MNHIRYRLLPGVYDGIDYLPGFQIPGFPSHLQGLCRLMICRLVCKGRRSFNTDVPGFRWFSAFFHYLILNLFQVIHHSVHGNGFFKSRFLLLRLIGIGQIDFFNVPDMFPLRCRGQAAMQPDRANIISPGTIFCLTFTASFFCASACKVRLRIPPRIPPVCLSPIGRGSHPLFLPIQSLVHAAAPGLFHFQTDACHIPP